MSGGHFDYKQYQIKEIIESIQSVIDNNGKLKPEKELWQDEEYLKKYPEEKYWSKYDDQVLKIMKDAIKYLTIAQIYAQRVDWFLSGDDGEDSLKERLKEDLKTKIKNK